jgi:hypothetical protein
VGITAGYSILARVCPVSGAQPMSEANALAAANALGITLTVPLHSSLFHYPDYLGMVPTSILC